MEEEILLKEIRGIFDGEKMVVSDTCSILVPSNYASKSMLIAGTELVYRVTDQKSYFKQVHTPKTKTGIGRVIRFDDNLRVELNSNGVVCYLLFLNAFETFYNLKEGDEVVFVYPEKLSRAEDNWCAIEAKL